MIDIQLGGDWYITSDPYNYVLRKKLPGLDKRGYQKNRIDGYYSTLTNALNGYKDLKLRNSDATNVTEVLAVLEEIQAEINDVLKGE